MSTLLKLCGCVVLAAVLYAGLQVNAGASVGQLPYSYPAPAATHTTVVKPEVIPQTDLTAYVDSQPLAAPVKPVHRMLAKVIVRVTPKTSPSLAPMLQRWNTTSSDATATWPDATDPTRLLPVSVQAQFACIRYHESRNHLHSLEPTSGAAGWYQFTPYIWEYAATHLSGVPMSAVNATGDEQSKVAVWYYKRNSGFTPEWDADYYACNL
jgi:hypothetical protein